MRDEASETRFEDDGLRYSTKSLKKDKIRLVPVPDSMKLVKRIGTHFVFGKPYLCPRVTFHKECPICDLRAKLWNSGDEDEKEMSKELNASIRYAYRVISRNDQADNNNVPSRVFVLEAPKAIHAEIWKALTGRDPDDDESEPDWDEALDIASEDAGHDVAISKKGSGMTGTNYFATVSKKPTKLHKSQKVRKRLLKMAQKIDFDEYAARDQDLDEVVERIINGEEDDGKSKKKKRRRDEEDDERELRRRKKGKLKDSKKKPKKKRRDDDDDDDDDDRPRKKKKRGTMDELKSKMNKAKNRKKKRRD